MVEESLNGAWSWLRVPRAGLIVLSIDGHFMKHRKLLACLLAGSIAFTGFAHAASPQQVTYDITESYAAGTVVVYLDKAYKAKWWANPGQSPAEVDTAANA
ncbi:hypothetical protein H9654_08790 [Stenotrophomonas sp. Sa5BUN4]|uniref:Uncharacterized protein n=1 Tax=Stenotrophomonas lacuserhaii TaxID=2760084 RepID=A0A8X8FSE1_9GAMM|nr:hypothetical protein [Stenotrophomonas pennii]MBD7954302.1 hypothetical protein [Stenotrophomonas pennii]